MFGLPTHLQNTDDIELKQIMQKAVMLQNGIVASQMAKSGVRGLMNYGVPLPDLRRIAAEAGANHNLARRLCQLNIRETRILASMLFDANQLTNDDFTLIYNSITNIDMAENFAQNIVSKIADMTFFDTLRNGDKWHLLTAIHGVGWCVTQHRQHSDNLSDWFVTNLETIINKNITETSRPIISTMSTIADMTEQKKLTIENVAQKLLTAQSPFAQNIGSQYIHMHQDMFEH
ncbi:MAG: DNA alkylation repair protein [Salinivirgaceae bacterium]|nr:DNA alkylation repair protein [Salinivirgaceae bacterium]